MLPTRVFPYHAARIALLAIGPLAAQEAVPAPPAAVEQPADVPTAPAELRPDGKATAAKSPAKPEPRRRKPATRDKPAQREPSLEPIEVQSRYDRETDARRNSTAAKMVFGRETLDRYGDTSIGEVLKRLPGVTVSGRPGRGGDIRMRGLGHGYTQILINGDPAPRGFSFDTLAPEEVERIEIYRAPVAEHSARAIAGTINIVLREDFSVRQTEIRVNATEEQGHLQPGASVQRSDTQGKLSYNIALNVFGKNQGNAVRTTTTGIDRATGKTDLLQQQFDASRTHGEGVHLSSRLNWKLDAGDQFNLTPFLMQSRSPTPGYSLLDQAQGAAPPAFVTANNLTEAQSTVARVGGDWQHRLSEGGRLRVRFLYGLANSQSDTAQQDFDAAGALSHTLSNAATIHDLTLSNGGKLSYPLHGGGEVSTGWELETVGRQEGAATVQDGILQLAQFGTQINARVTRAAAFAQRDWNLSPTWSSYAGLRWEGIATNSTTMGADLRNTSSVVSPLLQSLWRLGDEQRDHPDQLRLALARTYRAPTLNNLVARPTLSAAYPASGPNSPISPDKIGNPQLRPEIAWGLDAAVEHYLDQGGILSASAFDRRIENLMRTSTKLETVSWSPYQRWVSSPQNVGAASTHGIELEAKFQLGEFLANAPPLELRTNYSRFWSTVSQIVGPNNRLDQQPKQTANLGFDYRAHALPLTFGVNYNWTPAFTVQQSDNQIYGQGVKPVLDAYALWVFSPRTRLRFSIANALHRDYETTNTLLTPSGSEEADAQADTYLACSLRLEMRL
jgi:iron complex outermembrane receptor protein